MGKKARILRAIWEKDAFKMRKDKLIREKREKVERG